MRWRQRFFRRELTEKRLDAELRFHIEQRMADLIAGGMSREEARRQARLEFGGLDQVKEQCRDVGGSHIIETFIQDIRYGLRQLRRSPGFTAVAVITLALGIGANTAIFSVVNAVLFEPLPYQSPGQLVYISEFWPRERPANRVPTPDFVNWREHNRVFRGLASWGGSPVNLSGSGNPEVVQSAQVSEEFFSTLGVQPLLGRVFLPEEELPGGEHVVILSYALWQQRFGSDRDIIGKSVTIDGRPYAVVGVMPAGFRFPGDGREPQVFRPNVAATVANWHSPEYFRIQDVVGRLTPGVSLDAAKAQLTTLTARTHDQEPPQFLRMREGMEVRVVPLHERLTGNARPLLLVLAGAVGLVLLIACVNVACLELVRAAGRKREMAVRAAIGAARGRLARQLLTESVLLAALGGASGLLVSYWAMELVRIVWPQEIPQFVLISIDGRVLVFCLLVTALTGLLFGLVPTFSASREDLNDVLRESRMTAGKHGALRGPLAALELALAGMLLVGSGLLIRTFIHLATVDPGFDTHDLLSLKIALPENRYQRPGQQAAFFDQLLQRVRALPGVQSADISTGLPTEGHGFLIGMGVEGQLLPPSGLRPDVPFDTVSPGYFHTLGIPLIAGRPFTTSDQGNSAMVVVVNQAFVRRFFPGEKPLGKSVYTGVWRRIVGVVGDVRQQGPLHPPSMEVYGPYAQGPSPAVFLAVRSTADPRTLVGEIRNAVTSVDKNQPVSDVATMEQRLAGSIAAQRFNMLLVGTFGAFALLLAAVGIYGVISYSVEQGTHEIGIRMALGAKKGDVLRMVVGQGLKLSLIGVAIGIAGALALTRFLSSLLYGVKPTDPLTFAAVSLVLIAVALLACYIPARRAVKVDPMVALRYE